MVNDGKVTVSLFLPKTSKEVVLTENGKILDKYCTSLKGEQDINGNFRLTGNFINKDSIFKIITEGAILKVRNEYDEDEIFRITTITPTPFIISIIAFQITITDTKTLWLTDVRPTNQKGLSAMQYMYDKSDSMGFPKEIILTSDIDIINTAYYQLMSLHDALFTCDQSFINRWGGEVYRHQYNLTINKQIGSYNGVTIRENKNLVGFEANKSTDNLCTVAVGKGYDGILGDYIESPLKDKYDRAYTKVIEYSDVKVKTDSDINEDNETMLFDTLEEAKAELNRRIKNGFKNNKIDEIQATYNIDFLELSKTEEYKDYVQAERLYLGDFLDVIVDSLDIKIKTRVISKEIDYLKNRVTKMTVSNIPVESMSKTDSQIVGSIRDILSKNNNIDLGNYVDTVIKSGMKNSNVIVRKNEILIMDTDDIKTAKKVWRWNGAAMAHSSTGYYGKYNIGFTMDGILNANIIRTGILSTILIQNADGSFQIDLSGTSGASFFNDGQLAMRIENNSLNFFNWGKDGDYIGALTALCQNDDPNKPLIGLVNDLDSSVSIGYRDKKDSHTFHSYIDFDKYNILKSKQIAPIRVFEDVEMGNRNLYNPTLNFEGKQVYNSVGKDLVFKFPKKQGFVLSGTNGTFAWISEEGWSLKNLFYYNNCVNSSNDFYVGGNLKVNGKKNRIVKTELFGDISLNAYETSECYFGDIGRGKLKNGKCILRLDPKYLATVNTNIQYEVRTWAYGEGKVWVETKDMYPQYVIVHGDNDIEFGYEIMAKQKDYENIRLEEESKRKKEGKDENN
ncbi:phage tail spike protein [Clostridium baratii]|uniref:phage tail spike protein n=1 Tax=Clostridium baratii TaxID=1561 RepID=UPI0030D17C53